MIIFISWALVCYASIPSGVDRHVTIASYA